MGAVQPLFVFQVNGEDAEYLSTKELSGKKGGPSPETLTNLEPYRAYVRMVRENGQVTHPFYFETAAPPETSAELADEVLAMRAAYSLRFEEAEAGARRQFSYLDRYGRTLLTQGDTGAGRRGTTKGEVRRTMLRQSDADRTAEAEVRRALLGEHELELEDHVQEEEVPAAADGISAEMLELLEAKLRPDDETPDNAASDDEEEG